MAHNLEETELWAVIFARGEGHLIVLLQEVKCCLHTVLSFVFADECARGAPQRYSKANEPILVSGRSYIGRRSKLYSFCEVTSIRLLLRIGIKVMDEWQISLGYVRGSNIYVRGYLD